MKEMDEFILTKSQIEKIINKTKW